MKKNFVVLFLFISIMVVTLVFSVSCEKKNNVTVVSVEAVLDTFVTKYTVGDSLKIDGALIQITYSDGSVETVQVTADMVDKSSFSTAFPANRKTMKILYKNLVCTVPYQVQDKQLDVHIVKSYLENEPKSFLNGESLQVVNGLVVNELGEQILLCLELNNENVLKFPVKSIWVNSFSTKKAGECSCTVDYESDYGPVSVVWNYTVKNLASVSQVDFQGSISVYQNQNEDSLRKALSSKSFLVKYADDSEELVEYNSSFKISSFSSDKIGQSKCILSFTDSKGRNIKYTLEYTVKQNYAVYQVTFDQNYEGSSKITVNTFDGKVGSPQLDRKGYEILGWYIWDGTTLSSDPFDFDSIIEENITLRPRWRKLKYTLSIYSFGTLLQSIEYDIEKPPQLDTPSPIDGYTFSHFADEQGNIINSINKGTYGNIVLNCVWIAEGYNIEYNLNDGDSSFKATNSNPDKYYRDEVLELLPPQRNGYVFDGWFYNNEIITSTEGLAKNIKITARWHIAEYTLSLVNTITNETIRTIKFKITDSETRISDYVSELYFFHGWYRDSEYTEKLPVDGQNAYYLPSGSFGDISVYAKLDIKYTISLDARYDSKPSLIYFSDADTSVEFDVPNKFGSDFVCWIGQGIFNGINYFPDSSNKIVIDSNEIKSIMSSNNTQSANFVASYDYHQWNITYNLYTDYQGQNVISEDKFYTNQYKPLLVPERNGYEFLGWFANTEFSGSLYESLSPFSFDKDLTLYAKWNAKVFSITVDYGFDDIQKPFIPSSYTADDQIILPFLTYPNYNFIGWYLDSDYSLSQSSIIDKGTTGNLTLFAKWEPISLEMNLLNMNGAVYKGNLSYTLEQDSVILEDASKLGYKFEGWFLDRNLTNRVYEFSPSLYPEGRIFTAYAKWSLVEYSVNYVLNDTASQPAQNNNPNSVTVEDDLNLSIPTRVGYSFVGWYMSSSFSGSPVEFLISTTNDITLYAKWVERVYSITYENCDFENVNISKLPTSFKVNGAGTPISSITRQHYNFDGWFLGENKVSKVGLISDPSLCDDLVLTAKWTPKDYILTFSANGKTGKFNYTIEDFVDDTFTLPTLDSLIPNTLDEIVLKGREFIGWYKGNNTAVLYTTINISELANLAFNALTSFITYDIIYHLPEGAINPESNPISFTLQLSTVSVSSPTLENKVFSAWFTDEDFENLAGKVSNGKTSVTTTNEDMHLYAKFVDIYTINYELPDGVTLGSSIPREYNETKAIALGNPTASAFNFAGWWWVENKKIVSNTSEFGDFGNVTLLALVYDKSASAKLIFNLDDQNKTASITGYTGSSSFKVPSEVSGYRVTSIVDTALYGNNVITSVTLPKSLLSVGYRAFANCSKLATVVIEGGTISSEAFVNCPLLKTVTISPDATVSDGVFANCTALSTLNVGNNKAVVSYFAKTPNTDSTVCGGYYVPNSLNTVKIIGSPQNTNGLLSTCSLITKVYIDGTEFVELSLIDINVIKNNNAEVYVKEELLEEYQSRYERITFVVYK